MPLLITKIGSKKNHRLLGNECRNNSFGNLFPKIQLLVLLSTLAAFEKSLSAEAVDAGIRRFLQANSVRFGYGSAWDFHNSKGSFISSANFAAIYKSNSDVMEPSDLLLAATLNF